LRALIELTGLQVTEVSSCASALAVHDEERVAIVVTRYPMLESAGVDCLVGLSRRDRHVKIILVARGPSEAPLEPGLRAVAFEWLRYPLEREQLQSVLSRAAVGANAEAWPTPCAEYPEGAALHFVSDSMRELAKLALRVAVHDITVLITGESGTGKERIADLIVGASRRADKPYLRFNCASLSAELAEAELFGHSRGAFTGAVRSRPGLFGEADGGTLLLDEIGELGLSAQGKLLRVLQEGEIRPVGEERSRKVNVRILAATHRDLHRLCEEGTFRKDLFYRLNVVQLKTIPLRERQEDIAVIASHMLQRCRSRFGLSLPEAPQEFFDKIARYNWPGNVRELENAIEHMVVLSSPGSLDLSLLPVSGGEAELPELTLKERLDAYERELITKALMRAGNRRSAAAALLGISRVTLHEKLHKYGLARERERGDAGVAR
jgi:DNA-binding NtrC family response regulator